MLTRCVRVVAMVCLALLLVPVGDSMADVAPIQTPPPPPTSAPPQPGAQSTRRVIGKDAVVVTVNVPGSNTNARQRATRPVPAGGGQQSANLGGGGTLPTADGSGGGAKIGTFCDLNPGRPPCLLPDEVEPVGPGLPLAPQVEVDPGVAARQAVLSMTVPAPGLVVLPDPEGNKWGMIPIGLPVWAGDTNPGSPVSSTVTQQGLTITLVAQPGATTVDWGDGTVITCQSMTVRRQGLDPYAESPDCGHVYELPDDYTVTATRQWLVSWSAGGQSGVVELTSSDELVMPIGEIVTVLVPER